MLLWSGAVMCGFTINRDCESFTRDLIQQHAILSLRKALPVLRLSYSVHSMNNALSRRQKVNNLTEKI